MRITVHGDDADPADNVAELAERLEAWVSEEFGGVKVTVEQSLKVREREALTNAIARLEAAGIPDDARVYVDDENPHPSYARYARWDGMEGVGVDLEDEELDYAVAWLPSEAFLIDKSEGPYNPYITLNHIRTLEV